MDRTKIAKYALPVVLAVMLVMVGFGCSAPDVTTTTYDLPTTTTTTPQPTFTVTPTTTIPAVTTTLIEHQGKSFIWEITSESNTVYLLGSVHVAEANIFPLAGVIEDAFLEADVLVVEVNINEIDEMESLALALEYGAYPPGETLQDNLPEELYEKLGEKLAEWGMSVSLLNNYRPWFVENLLEVTSFEMLGYSSEYSIDLHLLEAAAARDMEIVELETVEFQRRLIADVPDDIMVELIEMNLDEPITVEDMEELFGYWETGDAAGMEALLFEGLDEAPEMAPYFQAMFTDRNYGILDKITGFLADDETYFVVVGAGHLVGEEGLVNLLDEAGYTVAQLED